MVKHAGSSNKWFHEQESIFLSLEIIQIDTSPYKLYTWVLTAVGKIYKQRTQLFAK